MIFPFRYFSRLCEADNFPRRGSAAASRAAIATEPADDLRQRLDRAERRLGQPRTVYQMLWVRGFRDPTISGRGFNLFKPLRRHFRATPFCRQALSRRDPRERGGERSAGAWNRLAQNRDSFRILCVFNALQGGKFPCPVATPISCSARSARLRRERRCLPPSRAPTLFRLATCGRARAVARSSSPRSEPCRRFPCAVSATRKVKPGVDPKTLARIGFLRNTFPPSARTRELC